MSTRVQDPVGDAVAPPPAGRHRTGTGLFHRLLGGTGELFITAGLLLLLFVAWQLWWTDVEANSAQAQAITTLEQEFTEPDTPDDPALPVEPKNPLVTLSDVPLGNAFAILRVPRWGKDYARPVLEGTSHRTLQKGVGHYPTTVMPGRIGNFAVAGHRTTYGKPFSDIEDLAQGDAVIVETKASYLVYRVQRHIIVRPSAVEVVAPVPQKPGVEPTQAWMTLTTCHPRFSAAYRYVVFARYEATFPRAGGLPASYLTLAGEA